MEPITILNGIKIIDLTVMIAGPTATRIMAEMGADVIHVEPHEGDDGRNSSTKFLGKEGTTYSVGNRSKRTITVDIRTAEGQAVMHRLLKDADIFMENTTPGVLERFNLGWEQISKLNPRLIHISGSGWGRSGPRATDGGYEVVIQSFVGAYKIKKEGEVPTGPGLLMGDATGPLLGAMGAMAALRERERTGRGHHITSSVLQGAMHQLATRAPLTDGLPQQEPGHEGSNAVYQASDSEWVCVAAKSPAEVEALRLAVGGTLTRETVAAFVASRTADDAAQALRDAAVPSITVRENVTDLARDEEAHALRLFVRTEHPTKGGLWMIGSHISIDGATLEPRNAAPVQGTNTDEVLLQAGYTPEEIAKMRESLAIG